MKGGNIKAIKVPENAPISDMNKAKWGISSATAPEKTDSVTLNGYLIYLSTKIKYQHQHVLVYSISQKYFF